MSAVDSEGPFREACPTLEARRAREHEASLERVAQLSQAGVERERRREARIDALTFAGVTATLLGTGVTLALALLDPRGPWLSLLCLATALCISAGIALMHRSRVRQHRAANRFRGR